MYAAYGVASPFLPAFVNERAVPPEQLGLVLAAGTAIRLASAPLAGRIGDVLAALRLVLVTCIALAAAVTLGYMPTRGFWPFLALTLLHAAFLAPMTASQRSFGRRPSCSPWPRSLPRACPRSRASFTASPSRCSTLPACSSLRASGRTAWKAPRRALYATVGIGVATALLTSASGMLYASLGPSRFWIMAALCAAACGLALRL